VGTGYLGAGSEEEAAHAAGLAHAPRGDGRPPESGSVSNLVRGSDPDPDPSLFFFCKK
jgi:hypothetical protein